MSDEEDAAITTAALSDPDNPPLGEAELAAMRPAAEVMPGQILAAAEARRRGQRGPQKAPKRVAVTLRLSHDVVEHFRSTGPGWQGRINAALRELVAAKK